MSMREDLANQLLPRHGEPIDPVAMARRDLQKVLPRRFYKEASAQEGEGGFALVLDGKNAHTPGRLPIRTPALALAQALAGEWNAQGEFIDPASMPLTRIVNSALDGVARDPAPVAEEIVRYAGSDMLLYRAGEPDGLVKAQAAAWDPVLAWAREDLGARFVLTEGVMFVIQPEHVSAAIAKAVESATGQGPTGVLRLAALHVLTTLTGSALLALAVARGRLDVREAWTAAHVDEDFQIGVWGQDAEALARRAIRWKEAQAAAAMLGLTS